MTNPLNAKVKIYAMATASYLCKNIDSVHDKEVDIYFPESEDSNDRVDFGSDIQHISVNGENEMVFVDKGFLLALISQNQRLSSNEAVYDDHRGTNYNYSDLHKLTLGIIFPDDITGYVE